MVRFATLDDTSKIMKFISDNWRPNHILARDEKFFRYFLQDGDRLNWVIAEENGTIIALEGFIPCGKNHRDIMNVMWKANHNTGDPVIGLKIMDYIYRNADVRIMSSPGINPKTIPIYEYLGYPTGKMKHWYRLNEGGGYNIAVIKNTTIVPLEKSSVRWKEFSTFKEMAQSMDMDKYKLSNPKPYKENWYIQHRYFDHPIYDYKNFSVEQNDGNVNAVFFYRVQEYHNSRALIMVDCIGDYNDFAQIGSIVDELLQHYGAEYADIYSTGLEDSLFYKAGFIDVDMTSNIIPKYFTPYVAKNIDMYYFSTDADIVLFNGDGDQDRPS